MPIQNTAISPVPSAAGEVDEHYVAPTVPVSEAARRAWREAVDALPDLIVGEPTVADDDGDRPRPATLTPLDVASRQGRLFMRQSATLEAQAAQLTQLAERLQARDRNREEAQTLQRQAEKRARETALTAIQMLDALEWAENALRENGQSDLAGAMASAQRDCSRRLAAVGVNEIPATHGLMDGALHEGMDVVRTNDVPRYHIVRVVRRGFQMGTDILRRAGVTTAMGDDAPPIADGAVDPALR